MGYWITRFNSVDLSTIEPQQDVGVAEVHRRALTLPNGLGFDGYGAEQAPVAVPYELRVRAELVEATQAALLSAWQPLAALVGQRGTLYRTPDGGTANSQSVPARLLQAPVQRGYEQMLVLPFELAFEVWAPTWAGTLNTPATTLTTSPIYATAVNNGNAVQRSVKITVTAGSSAMTWCKIVNETTGHHSGIEYSGTIAAGQSLVIDTADWSAKNNGVDDYAHLTFTTSWHAIEGFIRLAPGSNAVRVWRTGGGTNATVTLTFNDAWN